MNVLYIVELLLLIILILWDYRIDIDILEISIWLIRGLDFVMINIVRWFDKIKLYDIVNIIDGCLRLVFLFIIGLFYCIKRFIICYYMNVLLFFRLCVWRIRDN